MIQGLYAASGGRWRHTAPDPGSAFRHTTKKRYGTIGILAPMITKEIEVVGNRALAVKSVLEN